MSSVLEAPQAKQSQGLMLALRWLPVAFGLVLMYVPTYMEMWKYYWRKEDNAHGPLIIAVVTWLVWRRRTVLLAPPGDLQRLWGSLLIALGLVLYVIGRSQEFAQLDAFSQIPLLLGLLLVLQGKHAFRILLFPICFLAL